MDAGAAARGEAGQAHPAGDDGGAALGGGQGRLYLLHAVDVVEHDEGAPLAVAVRHGQRVRRARLAPLAVVGSDAHEVLAVGEGVADLLGDVHREGGLADAGRAGDDREGRAAALGGELFHQFGALALAAGEVGEVGGEREAGVVRSGAPAAGRFGRRGGLGRVGAHGLAAQDGHLQPAERRSGVHAEFRAQVLLDGAVLGEGVGLPSGAVEGLDQPLPEPLVTGVGAGHRTEFGERLATSAQGQLDVEAALGGAQPLLAERGHLVPVQDLGLHVRDRRALPEGERLAQQPGLVLGVLGALGGAQEFAEPREVEGVAGDREPVPAGHGLDGVVGDAELREEAAQPHDVGVESGLGGGGRRLAPDGALQELRGDHGAGPQQHCGEQRGRFRGWKGDGAFPVGNTHQAQHRESNRSAQTSPHYFTLQSMGRRPRPHTAGLNQPRRARRTGPHRPRLISQYDQIAPESPLHRTYTHA